jgi:SNF2 family DNA or RNA helicase
LRISHVLDASRRPGTSRIGQQRPLQVFAYVCGDTVGERIDEILTEKRALFADVIDGVTTTALCRLDLDNLLRAAAPSFRT